MSAHDQGLMQAMQSTLKFNSELKRFEFYIIAKCGIRSGCKICYYPLTGIVTRDDVEFGVITKSTDARGYMNAEIQSPYKPECYADNTVNWLDGNPVSVQYTAYIERIVIAIQATLAGITDISDLIGNHKDLFKMNNLYNNVEYISQRDNVIHGALGCSILHYDEFAHMCEYRSNAKHTFKGLIAGIPAAKVLELYDWSAPFRDQLDTYKKSLTYKLKKGEEREIAFIKPQVIHDFIKFIM